MLKKRVGIVGLGKQSLSDHISGVLNSKYAELVAVCDIDKNVVEKISKEYNVKGYTSYNKMFSEENLDFVIIAVPHKFHFDVMIPAIKKGIHIFKEKPSATNILEYKKIKNFLKKYKSYVTVNMQRKFNPIVQYFFSLLEKIGTVYSIDVNYFLNINDPFSGWRNNLSLSGGGCILDMGYHMIDLILWFFGLPDEVYAILNKNINEQLSSEVEHSSKILFHYTEGKYKGVIGSLDLSRVKNEKKEEIKVIGSNGTIILNKNNILFKNKEGIIQESFTKDLSSFDSRYKIDYFCKVIDGIYPNIDSFKDHFKHVAFIESCYKSFKYKKVFYPKDLLNKNLEKIKVKVNFNV